VNFTDNQKYNPAMAKRFAWMFLGRVMPVLVLFIITILYSRKLSYADYGIFQSIWMYSNIVSVLICFGLPAVIFSTNLNFLFSFIRAHQNRLRTFYLLLCVGGLSIFFVFAKNLNDSLKFLLVLFFIIQSMISIAETLLIKRNGEKISFIFNFIYSLLFLGWHLYNLYTGYSLYSLIAGIVILSVFKLIAILCVPRKNEKHIESFADKHFGNHWAFLGMNDTLGIISKWLDKIFLIYLLSAADFAVFFNGSIEIPLIGLLIGVTGNFLLIEISRNRQLTEKIITLFRQSFIKLSAIVFPLFFFLFFFREEIFSIVFNNKYNASLPIFMISLLVLPLRINNYTVILQCFAEGKKIMYGSIIDIVIAVLLMYFLYPVSGTTGVMLAIVISTWCQALYYVWHSAKVLNVSIFRILPLQKLAVKFLLLLVAYSVLIFLLSGFELKIKLAIGIIFSTVIVLADAFPYLKLFFNTPKVDTLQGPSKMVSD
jgi:O-antigen/teichoic acid export membrane protein